MIGDVGDGVVQHCAGIAADFRFFDRRLKYLTIVRELAQLLSLPVKGHNHRAIPRAQFL